MTAQFLSSVSAPPPPADMPAGREIPTRHDAALCPIEVSYLTGKSVRTLELERHKGNGIPFIKSDTGAVRYLRGYVDAWVARNLRTKAGDPAPSERRSHEAHPRPADGAPMAVVSRSP